MNNPRGIHFVATAGTVFFIALGFSYDPFTGLLAILVSTTSTLAAVAYVVKMEGQR